MKDSGKRMQSPTRE
jgi:hypothetical protein